MADGTKMVMAFGSFQRTVLAAPDVGRHDHVAAPAQPSRMLCSVDTVAIQGYGPTACSRNWSLASSASYPHRIGSNSVSRAPRGAARPRVAVTQ